MTAMTAEYSVISKAQTAQDDATYQRNLAPWLRKMAIEHLRSGKGKVAEGFRGAAKAGALDGSTDDFLNQQGKNGAWGTYVELAALGELFEVSIVVKDSNSQRKLSDKTKTYSIYQSPKTDAPTLTLENSNNNHWSFKGKAIGDGNCLYNAMALALKSIITQLAKPIQSAALKASDTAVKPETTVIAEQQNILTNSWTNIQNAFKIKPSEDASLAQKAAVQKNARTVKYNGEDVSEAQQIERDRQFAIRLAMRP